MKYGPNITRSQRIRAARGVGRFVRKGAARCPRIAQPRIVASAKAPCRRAESPRLDYAVGACFEREVGGGAEFEVGRSQSNFIERALCVFLGNLDVVECHIILPRCDRNALPIIDADTDVEIRIGIGDLACAS